MNLLVSSIFAALVFAAPVCANAATWNLESQGWWTQNQAGEPPEGRHIHAEVRFPLNQVVSGTLTLPVTVKLHKQPGRVSAVRVQLFNGSGKNALTVTVPVSLSCPGPDCESVVPVNIDTTRVTDGTYEFRITADIKAADAAFGKRFYQTTRWHATLANGNGPIGTAPQANRSPGAAGWYDGIGYTNVYCGPGGYNLIASPVSGTVSLSCRFASQTAFASIDPAFHAGNNPGTVLLDTFGGTKTVTFNSSAFSNGSHKLFLRTCKTIASGTGCGALVLPLEIAN